MKTKLQVNLDFQLILAEICHYNTPLNGKLFYLCVVTQKWVTDILDESVLAFIPNRKSGQFHGIWGKQDHSSLALSYTVLKVYSSRCGVLFIDAWLSRATDSIN